MAPIESLKKKKSKADIDSGRPDESSKNIIVINNTNPFPGIDAETAYIETLHTREGTGLNI